MGLDPGRMRRLHESKDREAVGVKLRARENLKTGSMDIGPQKIASSKAVLK